MTRYLFIISILFLFSCCNTRETNDLLFQGFVNPPSEARPFIRWWWNGNHINESEIVRQLDVMHRAGFGGVEINPIEMPKTAKDVGTKPVEWLGEEWNNLLAYTSAEVKNRGMFADLIVGSGWPFGGEFLKTDETIQRVIVNIIPYKGGETIHESMESLYRKASEAISRQTADTAQYYTLMFIRLVPVNMKSTSQVIDLSEKFSPSGMLTYPVSQGDYELVYGVLQKGHREVMHGAPGASGPVMDHYKKEITLAYLNRLKKISEDTGIPLHELIRALFCDSIELAGANWTDEINELFYNTYQYRLEPYYPFIFYDSYTGYTYMESVAAQNISDEIMRVRYDYNRLLASTFLSNFTQVFQDFCTMNNLKCKYQAYGTPFLMGMMDGYLIPDIPEGNNWIYSTEMSDKWVWNPGHGYMIWNLFAASAGHLKNRQIISSEAMTQTRGIFQTSLDEIKIHDDMNFISGINHSVLHGYNYSPVEAGFPGWIRYGSYFSEHNTWWPYVHKWVTYNSRLSYIFQQSTAVKSVAILNPEADIWSQNGLVRTPFHTEPWYCFRLWETLSQSGSSCDYVNERIIQDADTENKELKYGNMSYQAVILCNVHSLLPETAFSLKRFIEKGGKLIIIGDIPSRSPSFADSPKNDEIINRTFKTLAESENVFCVEKPFSEKQLLDWTKKMLELSDIQKDVLIDTDDVYQIRKQKDGRDIYFFVNSNRNEKRIFTANFPAKDKTPWIWCPETGERSVFPYEENTNELSIELLPSHSLLLVFEPDMPAHPGISASLPQSQPEKIQSHWTLHFEHVNGEKIDRSFERLPDLASSSDLQLSTFAGTIFYSTDTELNGTEKWLMLENVNKGITELKINGRDIGINWYGQPLFDISKEVKKGKNQIEIKYTTVLNNYCISLTDDPTVRQWTSGSQKIPIGIENIYTINQ